MVYAYSMKGRHCSGTFGGLVLVLLAAAALPAGPRAEEAVRVLVSEPGVRAAAAGVAVRVEGETDREALRIAAFANDALRRAGLKPYSVAPMRLYLKYVRPRVLSLRERPDVSVIGRGGSSGRTSLGIELQVPTDSEPGPAAPARHVLAARLENASGTVSWQAEAEMEIEDDGRGQEALRRLTETVAAALARAATP